MTSRWPTEDSRARARRCRASGDGRHSALDAQQHGQPCGGGAAIKWSPEGHQQRAIAPALRDSRCNGEREREGEKGEGRPDQELTGSTMGTSSEQGEVRWRRIHPRRSAAGVGDDATISRFAAS